MLDRVLDFLTAREMPSVSPDAGELSLAVAALLIEAARMDDEFGAAERAAIERLLQAKFGLTHDDVHALIGQAEEAVRRSSQLFPFTQKICRALRPEERVPIIEMLWTVAYADGVLDPHEDMLVRRLAGLIHVPDRERALARQRALAHIKTASG